MSTYTIQAHCTNCDKSVELTLERGKPADGTHECPNCGCQTARKSAPRVPLQKFIELPSHPWRDYSPFTLTTPPHQFDVPAQPKPFAEIYCGQPMILLALIIGLLPQPSPDWLPGQDAVVWSKYGEDDAQTLDGTHCTVVQIGRDYRGYWYDVQCQAWGDERRYRTNLVTRPEWESMQRQFIKERNYPSWWMPVFKDLE